MLWRFGLGHHARSLDRYLAQLDDGNIEVAPLIFCVFADKSDAHKLRAAQALSRLLTSSDAHGVRRLALQMRQRTSVTWGGNWGDREVESMFTPQMSDGEKRAVTIFASFHPNGYLRERAARRLPRFDDTLPYIALLLNDWVDEVRQASLTAFRARLAAADAAERLDAIPALESTRRGKRRDDAALAVALDEVFADPIGGDALAVGLRHPEALVRGLCLDSLLSARPDASLLSAYIERECDPFLRQRAFSGLSQQGVDASAIAHRLLKDRHPANRYAAMRYFQERDCDATLRAAMGALLDANARVRTLAQDIVRAKKPSADLREIYLQALNAQPCPAIAGLGEVGQPEDCARIEPYLHSGRPVQQRAAIAALMRLNAPTYRDRLVDLLSSPHPSVVRVARRLIERHGAQDFARIDETLHGTALAGTRIACASLLYTAPKWQRLIFMLRILHGGDEALRPQALTAINQWINAFNRSYAPGTAQQRQEIVRLTHACEARLGPSAANLLLFMAQG